MTEDTKKTNYFDVLMRWAEKDWLIILMAIVVLGACLITLHNIDDYQNKINQAWIEQWQASGCAAEYTTPNITFNLGGETFANKDRNQNASRPSTLNGQTD